MKDTEDEMKKKVTAKVENELEKLNVAIKALSTKLISRKHQTELSSTR